LTTYPKITIITPTLNQGNFIEQTISSVINQNYPNLEYIIIDGGSTDNTFEIIKKYEKNISYWISEPDKGQSDAINKGLKIATGEIINWLNSDDFYEPNALFKIADAFLANKNAKVVCARSRIFKNENETVSYTNGTDIYFENLAKTIGWARMDQPETFFHRSAIEKMGPLDVNLAFLMDRDWWIKYLFEFGLTDIIKIPDVIANFRLHESSKTVSHKFRFQIEHDTLFYSLAKTHNNLQFSELIKNTFSVNENFEIKNLPVVDKSLIEKILNYYILFRANEFYALNNKVVTRKLLDAINLKDLAKEDIVLWRKLNFRNNFIPIPIINFIRNISKLNFKTNS
jgi:glycosyltransferase involved in cell wall biosynthesis